MHETYSGYRFLLLFVILALNAFFAAAEVALVSSRRSRLQALADDLNEQGLPDNLFALRSAIEARVPHGRTDNGGANDADAWRKVRECGAEWSLVRGR